MAPTLLDDAAMERGLAALDGWTFAPEGERSAIARDRTLADFAAALAFVQQVGELAERANHHPDILLHDWNRVRLTLSTHSAGGLTQADFDLAQRIDGLGR